MINLVNLRKRARVAILGDNLVWAESVSCALGYEGYIVNIHTRPSAFWSDFESQQPEIVVIDAEFDGQPSTRMIFEIKRNLLSPSVIVFTENSDVQFVVNALRFGADNYVPLECGVESLLGAMRDSLMKQVTVRRDGDVKNQIEIRGFSSLTVREREVLNKIANGLSNKEAGRELGISPRTIEVHRARIMEKTGARNTADLVRIVMSA